MIRRIAWTSTFLILAGSLAFSAGLSVRFNAGSPLEPEDRAALAETLTRRCPALVEGKAELVELTTKLEQRRVDQNMHDRFYDSRFSFVTNEGEAIHGELRAASERPYNMGLELRELETRPAEFCR